MGRKEGHTTLLDQPHATSCESPEPEQALAPIDTNVSMFERLAKDPAVDVEKLQRLIDMQERVMRVNAKAAFDAAYARMQAELPEITEKGEIKVRGDLRSRYARLEDIQTAIKPILKTYGFAVRHRTEWPDERQGIIRIVGILSHEQGHSEESVFEAPMDKSEYRTDIQSMGSTVSYGRRYTTIDLLNIVTRGADNDGSTAGRPTPPDGYEKAVADLETAAERGLAIYEEAWSRLNVDFRNFAVKHDKQRWEAIKAKARGAKR